MEPQEPQSVAEYNSTPWLVRRIWLYRRQIAELEHCHVIWPGQQERIDKELAFWRGRLDECQMLLNKQRYDNAKKVIR